MLLFKYVTAYLLTYLLTNTFLLACYISTLYSCLQYLICLETVLVVVETEASDSGPAAANESHSVELLPETSSDPIPTLG